MSYPETWVKSSLADFRREPPLWTAVFTCRGRGASVLGGWRERGQELKAEGGMKKGGQGGTEGPRAELPGWGLLELECKAGVELVDSRQSLALRLVRFHFTHTLLNAFRK